MTDDPHLCLDRGREDEWKYAHLDTNDFSGEAGVYFLFRDKRLVYIGSSRDMPRRIAAHKKAGRPFSTSRTMPVPFASVADVVGAFTGIASPPPVVVMSTHAPTPQPKPKRAPRQREPRPARAPSAKEITCAISKAMSQLPKDKITYRVDEFCRETGMSRSAVYRLMESGQLKAMKMGRSTLIRAEDATAFISQLTPLERQSPKHD